MTRQEPIEQLIKTVIEYERNRTRALKLRRREPPVLFFLATLLLGGVASLTFFALYVRAGMSVAWLVLADFCILIAMGSGLAFPIAVAISVRRNWPAFSRGISDRFAFLATLGVDRDAEDFRFVDGLQREYDLATLRFVGKRLSSRVAHWRDDYGLMIGSPSQLKLLFILFSVIQLGFAPPVKSFFHENFLAFVGLAIAFILLLVMAVWEHPLLHRFEEIGQLLEFAAEYKKELSEAG